MTGPSPSNLDHGNENSRARLGVVVGGSWGEQERFFSCAPLGSLTSYIFFFRILLAVSGSCEGDGAVDVPWDGPPWRLVIGPEVNIIHFSFFSTKNLPTLNFGVAVR